MGTACASPAIPPHTPVNRPCLRAPSTVCAIRRSNPGIQGINLGSKLRVPAIHGERVLGQIVGSDREEIRLLSEDLGHHSHGGNFHHDAARHRCDPQRIRFFGEDCLGIPQLCNRSNHREHNPDLAEFRCAKKRAKLRAKDFRAVESDANSPLAQERIVFFRDRQIRERLVSTDIKGADDENLFPADHLLRSPCTPRIARLRLGRPRAP